MGYNGCARGSSASGRREIELLVIKLLSIACVGLLAWAPPLPLYIDGGGARITLPEIILEFHTATLVELERSDISRGGFLFKVVKPLKGKLAEKEVKLQISWEGAPPAAFKELKPGHNAVFFTECFDKRSLTCIDGIWSWTKPSQDGWEAGSVRSDFEHVFVGKSTELSDAVVKLLLGHDVVARCRRQETPAELEWVRYSMKTPHNKTLARDPSAPAVGKLPLSAWIAELQNPKPHDRVQAGLALAELGTAAAEAAPALEKALKDKDPEVRYAAVLALGAIAPEGKAAVDGLAHALVDSDWFVRFTAAQSLQKFGPRAKSAEPALVQAMHPSDAVKDFRPIRCGAALVALARIDPNSKQLEAGVRMVVDKLLDYDADDSDGSRVVGAEMLGECGPLARSALPALLKRLKDKQDDVRVATAEALVKIDPDTHSKEALGVLSGELKNHDALIRILAAEALGRLGPRAKEAEAALESILKDPEPEVRQAAGQALKKVSQK
jgi:HEAT repeat protein